MTDAKMFLFARWLATCYADDYLDMKMRHTSDMNFDPTTALCILNREDGHWYKKQIQHFNKTVYPNYVKNGSYRDAKTFLNTIDINEK